MNTPIILACAFVAFLLALAFFGFFAKGKPDGAHRLLTVASVEKEYLKHMQREGKCAVIYIGFFYESLIARPCSDALFEGLSFAEKEVLDMARSLNASAAKVDGNNFILCADLNVSSAKPMCARLISDCDGNSKIAGVCLGVFLSEEMNTSFKCAAGYAKKAARFAKSKNIGFQICTADTLAEIIQNETIESNIETFIDKNHFYPLFQPVVDAKSKEVVGCEALARLAGTDKSFALPHQFLDAVKKENLNKKFDIHIFKKCCEWQAGLSDRNKIVACNFSRITFATPNMANELIQIATDMHVLPETITLEITDALDGFDFSVMKENVDILKRAGFKIWLDDFGKGHIALKELSDLLPDVIGIDRSLLYAADTEQGRAVFESAVHMAKKMKAKVLCVGIETMAQAKIAESAGCDLLQGYFFFKPMSADALRDLLQPEKSQKKD